MKDLDNKIDRYKILLEMERDGILAKINLSDSTSDDEIIHYGNALEIIAIKINALTIARHN